MGRKRGRKRKFIYFYIASLILLNFLGCSFFKERLLIKNDTIGSQVKGQKNLDSNIKLLFAHLERARDLFQKRDYDASLQEAQLILSLENKKPPGDEALFLISLIYSHFDNPKKDYSKSIAFLKKLQQDFPQSPFVEEAKIWMNLMEENERLTQAVKKLNQRIEGLTRRIENLRQVIEEFKQVDLEIEEKKRER